MFAMNLKIILPVDVEMFTERVNRSKIQTAAQRFQGTLGIETHMHR